MKKGEIWLLELDKDKSVGREYYNDRPAIIIMSDKLVRTVSVVTIMPLSGSGMSEKRDILLKTTDKNKLSKNSIIKTGHIMSYDKTRFIHKIGEVDTGTMEKIEKYLKIHFGISQ